MKKQQTTHFGFETVDVHEKADRVRHVFDSVADAYDIMNDVMSMGLHRLWKDYAVSALGVCKDDTVLDIAGGTGDIAYRIDPLLGPHGSVTLCDINAAMLIRGRDRLLDAGCVRTRYVQGNGECLPFADNTFDAGICAFGLRNMTDIDAAMADMCRVLRPGGKAVILEFSHPQSPLLQTAYDAYSFHILPRLGTLIAKNSDGYRYLAESIRKHPHCDALTERMKQSGFTACDATCLCGGIVAVHSGYAP